MDTIETRGAQVGRRLAGNTVPHSSSRLALGADQEDSPLQSNRSSRFSLNYILIYLIQTINFA